MRFLFFCVFYLSDKQFLSKCRDLHGCISGIRCVCFRSGVRFLLADLSCLQLGHLSATQLKQVIMLSMCESPLPTADTQRYLFWLRAEWLWNISFHLRPAAVNGACVNTQGSVSKSFCALEFPSTMVYKEMFRTALFCYLWVAGSTICQQARRFSIWVFTHKSKCSGSFNFSVALRGLPRALALACANGKITIFLDLSSSGALCTMPYHCS